MESQKKNIAVDEKRRLVLAIYDITDNKRRNKMVKCLEAYGIRVQKSAFEAKLTPSVCDDMMRRASRLIDPKEDSLRIYVLTGNAYVESWGISEEHESEVIII